MADPSSCPPTKKPKRDDHPPHSWGTLVTEEEHNHVKHHGQSAAAFHWVFSWCQYPDDWKDYFDMNKHLIVKLFVSEETCPTTGTVRLQGWLKLNSKNSPRTYLQFPGGIRFRVMWSTERKNTKFIGSLQGPFLAWGLPVPYVPELVLSHWMTELLTILDGPENVGPARRDIHWIWEGAGQADKTMFQQWVYTTKPLVCTVTGRANDARHTVAEFTKKNGRTPRVILVNIPRGKKDHLNYGVIEECKDMFFHSGKYKGSTVSGPRPHVIVFANDRPDTSQMSTDRWRIARIVDEELHWEGPTGRTISDGEGPTTLKHTEAEDCIKYI